MEIKEIYEKIKIEFGDAILELKDEKNFEPFIKVKPEVITELCLFLRDDSNLMFDYLVNLTGMDNGKELGVVYHLYSLKYYHRLVIKIDLDKSKPTLPSVELVWKTANWHEREAYDMFGIIFENHPNLIRILTPYDWEGHPLLKDYKVQEYYHGIKVPY